MANSALKQVSSHGALASARQAKSASQGDDNFAQSSSSDYTAREAIPQTPVNNNLGYQNMPESEPYLAREGQVADYRRQNRIDARQSAISQRDFVKQGFAERQAQREAGSSSDAVNDVGYRNRSTAKQASVQNKSISTNASEMGIAVAETVASKYINLYIASAIVTGNGLVLALIGIVPFIFVSLPLSFLIILFTLLQVKKIGLLPMPRLGIATADEWALTSAVATTSLIFLLILSMIGAWMFLQLYQMTPYLKALAWACSFFNFNELICATAEAVTG